MFACSNFKEEAQEEIISINHQTLKAEPFGPAFFIDIFHVVILFLLIGKNLQCLMRQLCLVPFYETHRGLSRSPSSNINFPSIHSAKM